MLRKEVLIIQFDFATPLIPRPELDLDIEQYLKGRQMGAAVSDLPTGPAFSLRRGYIEGLRTFLAGKNIDPRSIAGFYTGPENLLSDSVATGFSKGRKRQVPNVQRDFRVRDLKYPEKLDYVSTWLVELQTRTMQERGGFALGFMVGVAKDFGLTLNPLEIPNDDPSYHAFINGLTAEPRAVWRASKYSSRDKILFKGKDPLVAQLEGYEWEDDQMYHAGLRVWIHSLGLRIDTWQLRHPEALRAFKAALTGQVLPEYEPQEWKIPVKNKDDLNSLIDHRFGEKFSKSTLFDDAPNPYEEARFWGRSGYKLGKSARLTQSQTS